MVTRKAQERRALGIISQTSDKDLGVAASTPSKKARRIPSSANFP
jgi:hypothetical protein